MNFVGVVPVPRGISGWTGAAGASGVSGYSGYSGITPVSGPLLVQQKTDSSTVTSIRQFPLDAPVTAGNAVVLCFSTNAVAPAFVITPRFTDGGAENLVDLPPASGTGIWSIIYYLTNVAEGSQTVRYRMNIAGVKNVWVGEFSGLANSVPSATSTNSGVASTAVSTGSIDPIMPNNLIVGQYASVLDSYVSGPDSGFTALTSTGDTGAFQQEGYIIQSAATSKNPGWTITADSWAACAVAFAASTQSSVVVSGAGTAAANGTYTFRGMYDGGMGIFPYYNRSDKPDNPVSFSIVNQVGQWVITPVNQDDGNLYSGDPETVVNFPWLTTYTEADLGASPPPTVQMA